MSGLEFTRAAQWPWLLLLPVLTAMLYMALSRTRLHVRRYGVESTDAVPSPLGRALLLTLLCGLAFVCWLDPRLGEETVAVERRGLDLVFCLDTSRSMLAQDLEPTRLAAAVRDIHSVLPDLHGGDRVGLVVFAGKARTWIPLTHDVDSFGQLLDEVDTNVVPVGGTDLGAALDAARKLLDPDQSQTSVVVLLTDGEDHGGKGRAAARELAAADVVVHCVGYGDTRGSKITVRENGREAFLKAGDGEEVVSKLDADSLRAIAHATGGEFLRAEAMVLPLRQLHDKRLAAMQQRVYESGKEQQKQPRYQWVLLPVITLLVLEMMLSGGRRR